jgi:hypothetical protein
MYQLLDSGEWKIGRNCREAIAGIPTLMISTANIEDVQKSDTIADDVGDALRYGIFSRLQNRSVKPKSVERQELLDSKPDMQSKYMADLRLQAQEAESKKKIGQIGRIPSWKQKLSMNKRRANQAYYDAVKRMGEKNVDQ